MSNLISTAELAAELGARKLVVIDATWHLPLPGQPQRDAQAEYLRCHLAGARFADLDAISEQDSSLPHMLPSAEQFQAQMRGIGVSRDSKVVVYDSLGLFSAARLWWMLRSFGHCRVAVLDGGLPKWQAEGRPVETGEVTGGAGDFEAKLREELVCSLDAVRKAPLVLDARSSARFRGDAPEPRPGLSSGHMPGARNLPFDRLICDGRLRPSSELREFFAALGVRQGVPVVTSCGSGVTAAIINLALEEIGHRPHALYDGSWAEYAACCPSEIVMGE